MQTAQEAVLASALFAGLTEKQAQAYLAGIGQRKAQFGSGQCVMELGCVPRELGIILYGAVTADRLDYNGNEVQFAQLGAGRLLCAAEAVSGMGSACSYFAKENTGVLFLSVQDILHPKSFDEIQACVLRSLLQELAKQECMVSYKTVILSMHDLRAKIISMLSGYAYRQHSTRIVLPINRRQMAQYLCVNRSALSQQLAKMQREGLIDFYRSSFYLRYMEGAAGGQPDGSEREV